MPNVELPDGRIIEDVPEGTTKEQLTSKLIGSGVLSGNEDWLQTAKPAEENQPEKVGEVKSYAPGISDERLQQNIQKVANDSPERQRNIGLTARAVGQGLASPVTLPSDLIALGSNAAFGTKIKGGSQVVSEGLSAFGLPEPKTAGERIAGATIEGATGGAAISKGVKAVATAPKFIKNLVNASTAVDAVAGAGAGAGSSVAGEITDNPLIRLAAGVAGGMISGKLASAVTKPTPETPKILSDVAEKGIDETGAFQNVRQGIVKEAARQEKKVNKLFKSAQEQGQKAYIAADDLTKFANDLRRGVKNEIDLEGKNLINRTADVVEGLTNEGLTASNINELQSIRRSATRISSKGRPDSNAAGDVVRKIDDFFDKVPIQGDEKAAKLWKDAISTSREYFKRFDNPKKIAQAIDSSQPLEAIEKSFLGTGSVSNQKDLAKTYQETLKAVNPKRVEETGFAMRQSALNRMIKDAAKSSDSGDGLSASRLSNSIRNLRRENTSFWKEFTPEEKQTLSKLEVELRKTAEGGTINKVYSAVESILRKGLRSNVELPRTLKAKTIVTVDDLLELSSTRPKVPTAPIAATVAASQSSQQENK